MLKFYPDQRIPAIRRFIQDVLAVLWVTFWAFAGWLTYQTAIQLEVIADGLRDTGRTFNDWLAAFRQAVPKGVPYLSDFLVKQAAALQIHTGDSLIGLSTTVRTDILQLSVALALLIAIPPISYMLLTYGVWRYRDAVEMGSALMFVRVAERSGRIEQAKALLAYRALATLSFRQLMKASKDPVGDIANRDYDRLSAEMLSRAGLQPWRLDPLPPLDRPLLSPGKPGSG